MTIKKNWKNSQIISPWQSDTVGLYDDGYRSKVKLWKESQELKVMSIRQKINMLQTQKPISIISEGSLLFTIHDASPQHFLLAIGFELKLFLLWICYNSPCCIVMTNSRNWRKYEWEGWKKKDFGRYYGHVDRFCQYWSGLGLSVRLMTPVEMGLMWASLFMGVPSFATLGTDCVRRACSVSHCHDSFLINLWLFLLSLHAPIYCSYSVLA